MLMKTFGYFFMMNALALLSTSVMAQNNDPQRSSRSAAQYDAACIDENIADTRDLMYFARMATERGSTSETIEVANDLVTDLSELLYSMEQLAVAGAGANTKPGTGNGSLKEGEDLDKKIAVAHGFTFDTTWLGGMMRLQQTKLNALAEQKEKATNTRLKAAVTDAIPVLKRYITRLNTLQKQIVRKDIQEKKEKAREDAARERAGKKR